MSDVPVKPKKKFEKTYPRLRIVPLTLKNRIKRVQVYKCYEPSRGIAGHSVLLVEFSEDLHGNVDLHGLACDYASLCVSSAPQPLRVKNMHATHIDMRSEYVEVNTQI